MENADKQLVKSIKSLLCEIREPFPESGIENLIHSLLDRPHWARVATFGGKLVENCLSEGTLVITDKGLVPIEGLTRDMRVWDGEEYVRHSGVLYQGRQVVMTYDGLTATPDHKIYIDEDRKVALRELAGRDSAEGKRHVYDVLNAGPRHRFAVWNGERALIVSNCVQGISRDLLCHALEQLRDMRIVAHVHDEIVRPERALLKAVIGTAA